MPSCKKGKKIPYYYDTKVYDMMKTHTRTYLSGSGSVVRWYKHVPQISFNIIHIHIYFKIHLFLLLFSKTG